MGLCVSRIKIDDMAAGGFRLLSAAEHVHNRATVGMHSYIGVVTGNRLEDRVTSLFQTAVLVGDYCQHVEGLGVEWRARGDVLAKLLGLVSAPSLKMCFSLG